MVSGEASRVAELPDEDVMGETSFATMRDIEGPDEDSDIEGQQAIGKAPGPELPILACSATNHPLLWPGRSSFPPWPNLMGWV